jgi:hypothetical protein
LQRIGRIAELDAYPAELDAELGPVGDRERRQLGGADRITGAGAEQSGAQ